MVWLTVTEYLSLLTTDMFPLSNHNPIFPSFIIYHRIFVRVHDVTSGDRIAQYSSREPEFTHGIFAFVLLNFLVVCVVFCRTLFCCLQFTVSDYPLNTSQLKFERSFFQRRVFKHTSWWSVRNRISLRVFVQDILISMSRPKGIEERCRLNS